MIDAFIANFGDILPFILIGFGTGFVKGFAIILALGVLLSLFTAMWISRILILVAGHRMRKNTKAFTGV